MKKIIVLSAVLTMFLIACRKDMTNLNTNPKVPTVVPGNPLFSNAQKNFTDILTTPNVNNNIFEFIVQHWAATTYPQESRYILSERNIPQNWWTILYRDVLRDLNESIRIISEETTITDEQKTNQTNRLAIARVMWVHAFYVLVSTFGDIPYTEALDINKATPKYDQQRTVYYSLLDSLDMAISRLDVSGTSFGSADLIYGGNVSHWFKYANSLKLKMAMNLADVDANKAKTLVEQAAPNVLKSNADNAVFQYTTTPPNVNPIWTNLVQSNRNDFVPANTLVNVMNTANDPRRQFYFTTDPNGGYSGGIYGSGNTFSKFSHISETVTEPDFPAVLLGYDEVEFLLAEAVERGMSVGGTAAEHYNKAVTASILYWGGSPEEANSYLQQASVNYSTAPGPWQKKIGTQEWIALFTRNFDAWVNWRRLDYPQLVAPPSAVSAIPIRYTYPSNEQNLNQTNYDAASASIGGDEVTTKLFWDIH